MSKEYKFNGKAYVVKKEKRGCEGCAFDREGADTCRKFLNKKGVPHCSRHNIIFVEKSAAKSELPPLTARLKTLIEHFKESNDVVKDLPFLPARPANKFIVCLTENCKLAPAGIPKIHPTRESAEKEAERLCKLHHQEFVVLQVVSSVKPQEPKKEVFA